MGSRLEALNLASETLQESARRIAFPCQRQPFMARSGRYCVSSPTFPVSSIDLDVKPERLTVLSPKSQMVAPRSRLKSGDYLPMPLTISWPPSHVPLGIRSIALDDGSTAKGFLVESAGLLGGSDISSFGCWRRFCRIAFSLEHLINGLCEDKGS